MEHQNQELVVNKDLLKEVLQVLKDVMDKLDAITDNPKVAMIMKLLHGVIFAIEMII